MTRKRPTRGLSGLLGDVPDLTRSPQAEQALPVADLRSGSGQPRRAFDEASLEALAASIREQGVLQPLLVRPVDGGHEIVAGERRWRAAQLAGLTEVPVIIRSLDDHQARIAALVENLQRENLNVIDELDAKLALISLALDLTVQEVRPRLLALLREEPGPMQETLNTLFAPLGETWESFTRNKLRILNWPEPLLDAVRAGLPFTLASVIVGVPAEHHARLIELATSGMSRAELRQEVEQLGKASRKGETSPALETGRKLANRHFMSRLSPEDRKAVERWLAKMPPVLRGSAEEGG
ncbi:ParB/RepB/Spo0J family partition protein [Deinococcus sp. YIM 134068]|uniref:ParB/RepB/Spo0J family partition protein n=1 Tax=Deinococcus lichenicola TaxID=3118910 RepID=UPI002F946D70